MCFTLSDKSVNEYVKQQQQQHTQQQHQPFINSNHVQSNDTLVYRVQNIRNRINVRSRTWRTMLFEGRNTYVIIIRP